MSKMAGKTEFPASYRSQDKCPPTGGATRSPAAKAPSSAQRSEALGKKK